MSVPVYKDLDKSALDLITKGFSTDHSIDVEGGSADGIKFKASSTHTADALNALFETTKVCTPCDVTLKATTKSDKNVPVYGFEATYEPKRVEGLKLTFNSECKTPAEGQVDVNKLTVLYKHKDLVTVEESIAYSKSKLTMTSSVALAYQAVRAGAHALTTFTLEGEKKFALGGFGFKLAYVPNKTLTVAACYDQNEKGSSAGTTLYYKKDNTELAGHVTIDPKKPSQVPAFTTAISHAQDAKTTIKAKLCSTKRAVALSLKHQLSDALAVTFSSECGNCCPKSEDSKATIIHKHGVAVNLKL